MGHIGKGNNVLENYRRRLLPQSKDIGLGLTQDIKTDKKSVTEEILSKLAQRAIKSFRKRILK